MLVFHALTVPKCHLFPMSTSYNMFPRLFSPPSPSKRQQTHLIPPQPNPPCDPPLPLPINPLLGQTKHIPQRPNLQAIEIPIHGALHQRLKLQHALLNLQPRLRIYLLPIVVYSRGPVLSGVERGEAEEGGVGGKESGFEGVGAAVEDFVYGVYDFVEEGLDGVSGLWDYGSGEGGIRTMGGQVKCSVRRRFSCCLKFAISCLSSRSSATQAIQVLCLAIHRVAMSSAKVVANPTRVFTRGTCLRHWPRVAWRPSLLPHRVLVGSPILPHSSMLASSWMIRSSRHTAGAGPRAQPVVGEWENSSDFRMRRKAELTGRSATKRYALGPLGIRFAKRDLVPNNLTVDHWPSMPDILEGRLES